MLQIQNSNATRKEDSDNADGPGQLWTQASLPLRPYNPTPVTSSPSRSEYITIDDLISLAQQLAAGLAKLGEYRHPLDVRRGAKGEVGKLAFDEESQSIKAGSKTYFMDIKKSADGRPFLVITESRFKGDGQDRERNSIVVFPEHAQEFLHALQAIIGKLV